MAKYVDLQLKLNEQMTDITAFKDSYNKTLPTGFPPASTTLLRQFQNTHPTLFKENEEWSIIKHRKKFLDWHLINQNSL